MDPSIVIFVVGSSATFLLSYWAFNRRSAKSQTGRQTDRVQRFGARKMSFLDGLRHEAALRAHAVLEAAADRTRRGAASAPIDAETLVRLRETRAMLQSLLPREFTVEFDHIVQLLRVPSSIRNAELDAALARLALKANELDGEARRRPASLPAGMQRPLSRMPAFRAAGGAT